MVFEFFRHAEYRIYKTSVCSKASFLFTVISLLTVGLPLLIVYRTDGFYVKISQFREQPEYRFKHDVVLYLETADPNVFYLYSTFDSLNRREKHRLITPIVKYSELDMNYDRLPDTLQLKVETELTPNSPPIVGVKLALTFDMQLTSKIAIQFPALVYLEKSSPVAGGKLSFISDVQIHQKELLHLSYNMHRGREFPNPTAFLGTVKPQQMEAVFSQPDSLEALLLESRSRNLTAITVQPFAVWRSGNSGNFEINVDLRFLEQTFEYRSGFWHLMKWAWVQYIAIFLIFVLLSKQIKTFIFKNQLVQSSAQSTVKFHRE